ncbi:lignin-forming anionic peroxidase-like [Tripterygium wilfordii]|uniref:lignin-forming anionic peroxidase-like n=1 Tax=Tripterygium wilfordii TaxID=458696 RepID=UPI0018F8482C|nr:lignin-forming anionic peroxidase-like [Tripterygium wilfordii]
MERFAFVFVLVLSQLFLLLQYDYFSCSTFYQYWCFNVDALYHEQTCQSQLSSTIYESTCPNALTTIRTSIRSAIAKERRMAASLIRLHFHDCFAVGCDASILLYETSSIQSEKTTSPNNGSVRGYGVIDNAKAEVEKACPGIVSCADIIIVAARDASEYVGGPSWIVKLGRRDSTTASRTLVEGGDLPAFTDGLEQLIGLLFSNKGLNARDMVALSGSHTIGQAQCFTFRDRIYSNNASDIDVGFASTRKRGCPASGGNGNLAPMDLVTPNYFDNNYFKNLQQRKGLLHSDQVLFSGGSTDSIVNDYSKNANTFKSDFASAMIKMGDIGVLPGFAGQIRRICGAVN